MRNNGNRMIDEEDVFMRQEFSRRPVKTAPELHPHQEVVIVYSDGSTGNVRVMDHERGMHYRVIDLSGRFILVEYDKAAHVVRPRFPTKPPILKEDKKAVKR